MCTLNIAMMTKAGQIPSDILDILAIATHQDYVSNNDGVGYWRGGELLRSPMWVPQGAILPNEEIGNCFLSHTRHATCAKDSPLALQPFLENEWIFMHNGVFAFKDDREMNFDTYSDSWYYFQLLLKEAEKLQLTSLNVAGWKQAVEDTHKYLLPQSSYSCFLYDAVEQEGYYWKHGRNMYISESKDMVYLSTLNKSGLIGEDMILIKDNTLYGFWYDANDNLSIQKVDLNIKGTRYDKPTVSSKDIPAEREWIQRLAAYKGPFTKESWLDFGEDDEESNFRDAWQ